MSEKYIVEIDESIIDLARDYLTNRKDEVAQLRTKLTDKDYDYLKGLFHKVCGSSGSYGFMDISKIAGDIEDRINASQTDNISSKVEEYINQVEKTEISAIE